MTTIVGNIAYDVDLDTSKLIASQREADKSLNKLETSLTSVSKATKMQMVAMELEAAVAREMAKANTDAAIANAKLGDEANKAAGAMGKQALSAKQLAAATRGLPAQFTDIFTSIASGQNPMTVLLQQGGQLKDMFGGVGNAASALGQYLVRLLNPLVLIGGAIATLAVGFLKGSQETKEFNRSIELTGGVAGVTAAQLSNMAARMDGLSNVTRGKAAESLNDFVGAGVRGGEALEKFTTAAIRLEQAGGPAVADTAKAFKALEKDPVQAALKLNEAVNFLTADLYKQIKTLSDQGREVDAARVAQEAYADAILVRAPRITENLGSIERAWRAIVGTAKEGWDALLGVGRGATPEDRIAKTRQQLEQLQNELRGGGFSTTGGGAATGRGMGPRARQEKEREVEALREFLRLQERSVTLSRDAARSDADRANALRAQVDFDKQGDKFLDRKSQMEREIAKARELAVTLGLKEEDLQKRIAAIRESYADKSPKFDGVAYLMELQERTATAYEKIGLIEEEAFRKAESLRKASKISEQQYQDALLLIRQAGAKARADLADKQEKEEILRIFRADGERMAAERQAEQQRNKGRDFAGDIVAGGDEISQVQRRLQEQSALLQQYAAIDQENAQLYAQARVALEEQTSARIAEIRQRQIADQQAQAQATLSAYGNLFGQITDLMARSGRQQSTLAKAAFLAQKAVAVAEIIMNTERGAAAALGLGPFGIPVATYIRAAGYASAGIVTGLAIGEVAGGRQYGGPVSADTMYRVNETGRPEMYTASNGMQYMLPTRDGRVTAADKVGRSGNSTSTVINQTVNFDSGPGANTKSQLQMVEEAMVLLQRSQRIA